MNQKQLSPTTSRRLLAYSAAASVGAFALPTASEAEVQHTDLDPDTLINVGDTSFGIDFDNNSVDDVVIFLNDQNVTVQGFNDPATTIFTTGGYYIESFALGEPINDFSTLYTFPNRRMALDDTFNFFSGAESYLGARVDIGGNDHYGWVGVEVVDEPGLNDLSFIVRDFAYEDIPGLEILAGSLTSVPEPSAYAMGLGLLALGAAGLKVRRRNNKSK